MIVTNEEQREAEPDDDGGERPAHVRVEDDADATQDVPSAAPTTSGAGERPPPPPE